MIKKIFSLEGIKQIYKVRDGEGNLDWEQVLATVIQVGLILGTLYFLYLIGVI